MIRVANLLGLDDLMPQRYRESLERMDCIFPGEVEWGEFAVRSSTNSFLGKKKEQVHS